jgi:hypothetical protein
MLFPPNKYRNLFVSIFLSANLIYSAACFNPASSNANADNKNSNQNSAANTNSVKDDSAELANIIKLPEQPDEVVWRETEVAEKGKKLVAVLKYKPEEAGKIAAAAEKIKPAEDVEIGTEDWFPDELVAQSQVSGSEALKAKAYSANDFLNPPYKNGRLARIDETDYFILEVTAY